MDQLGRDGVVMEAKPPFILPKREWGPGPWQDEPDLVRFTHAGFDCAIFRQMTGHGALCGYVAVPPTHPWWGVDHGTCTASPQCAPEVTDMTEVRNVLPFPLGSRWAARMAEPHWWCGHRPEILLDAHGGVTYSGPMEHLDDEPLGFDWGFGFDCAHSGDYAPLLEATVRACYLWQGKLEELAQREALFANLPDPLRDVYRDLAYVRHEVESLAAQLALVRQMTPS